MTYDVRFVSEISDEEDFEDLLRHYFRVVLKAVERAGGPKLSPDELAAKSMAQNDEYLPPGGRTALVRDAKGKLMGCASLRRIAGEAVEMKRMFVRPEAQRQGLGNRLFHMRIEEARRMGAKAVYADTARGNRPMLAIYESFGFRYVDRYEGNANPEEFDPFLVYLEYRFE